MRSTLSRPLHSVAIFLLGIIIISSTPTAAVTCVNPTTQQQNQVLVLFQSETGGTYKLAKAISEGIETVANVKAVLRQIPTSNKKFIDSIPLVKTDELIDYDGIALVSPIHFAGSTPEMCQFLDSTINLWEKRALEGKPASVFMSAGSGAGSEMVVLSLWGDLASHGMLIVPTGIIGAAEIDKRIPQGSNPFGTVALTGIPGSERPSVGELDGAKLQGAALAKAAKAVQQFKLISAKTNNVIPEAEPKNTIKNLENEYDKIEQRIADLGINLQAPSPAGNYVPFKKVGQLIYVNQVALKNSVIVHPGTIGNTVSEYQAREATRLTMENVLAVLQQATNRDLSRVKQVVQLTGYFNTPAGYKNHASLMNEASNLVVSIFGDSGKHTRATIGAVSLPLDSPV